MITGRRDRAGSPTSTGRGAAHLLLKLLQTRPDAKGVKVPRNPEESEPVRSGRTRREIGWVVGGLIGLLGLMALQSVAIARSRIHWDEFALLHLADLTLARGELEAGGRPGLAVALLLPFVERCANELAVMQDARLLWLAITFLFLTGMWAWLVQLAPTRRGGHLGAALGIALLALPPAFLDSSLQVRTDHLALAGGAWGGALLLVSQRRPWLSLAAGLAFGIGLLGSQKVIYLGALAGLVAVGQLALKRDLRPNREIFRSVGTLLGIGAVWIAFRSWAEASFVVAESAPVVKPLTRDFVERGFSLFAYYRETLGWREYRALLPELIPHIVLAGALFAVTLHALRRRADDLGPLALSCAVLGLGMAVAIFHAAAFRYFWLTLGVFAAVGFALAARPLSDRIPPRWRTPATAALACCLAFPAVFHWSAQLTDSQQVQRESLAFVHRNFSPQVAGFHPESGLFCQAGEQPLPTYFSQHIYQYFEGPRRDRNIDWVIERFREERVAFLLESFRLSQFPVEVRRFWDENYQPYSGSVFVAGRRLSGNRGEQAEFELVVPGAYRWLPLDGRQSLEIEGRVVAPGEIVELTDGLHRAAFVEDLSRGLLLLALNERPGEAPLAFYR